MGFEPQMIRLPFPLHHMHICGCPTSYTSGFIKFVLIRQKYLRYGKKKPYFLCLTEGESKSLSHPEPTNEILTH